MDIANLIIRVTNEGLDRATRELRRLQENAQGAQNANERFGKSIADLNKLALVGFGALTAVVGGSIKTAMSFESAMAEVNKTVDFAASNGLANLRGELEQLTKTIPLTFEELAAVAATGGQLGIAEKNLANFTEVMAKMGVAFDIPAQQAADSMAKIANVFQIPIENIDRLGDAINTLSNNTPATAAQLIDSLQRVGGVAKVFGLSEDATLGLTGALIAMGKPAEVASTAVNSLLTSFSTLDNATKSQLIGFEQLGLNIDDFSKLVATDGKQAIITYLEAINKLEQSKRIGTNALIIGKEFGDDITMLAGSVGVLENNWEMLGETVNSTKDYFGSMESEFVKMSDTTANKMTIVQSNIRLVAASVGEAFLPAVNELLASLVPVIEKMTAWAQANPELIVQIAKVTASVLGAIIAMAAISGAIGVVISTFQGLSAIFGVAKIAIMALSGPIGLTVIALGILVAAGALVYQNWDLIKQKATEIWGAITTYISNKINEIKNYFSTNFPAMTAIVSGSIEIIKTLFVGGFNLIKNTVTTVLGVIKAVISGDFKAIPDIIGNGLKTAVTIVSGMMTNILNVIKEAGKKLFNIGRDFIQGFINGIKSVGSSVVNAASGMVGNAIAAVKKRQDSASPSKVTTKLGKDFSKGMENGIKKGAKAVKTEAQKMAESAVKAVQDGVAGLKRELALFGNDSALAALDYDVKVGKFGGANTGELRSLTGQLEAAKAAAKAKDMLAAANKSVQDSIDGLIKQQALFGNNSALASLMYDIEHTEKYKGVTQELTDKLIEQTRALEQLGMTAKATDAIRARFAQLEKDKQASSDGLDKMLGGIEQETPMGKIQADYEQRLEVVRQFEQLHTDEVQKAAEARMAVEQSYQDAKRNLMLTQGEALFGDLAGLAKGFAGEQSGIYKALFAVEKGFAIAQSAIAIQTSIAKAMAVGFPANIPIIGQAVSQGMGIISSIKGITAGFKQGGYTGNMGASQVAGVVHGQEYVFDAQATKRIGVDNLNAMRRGDKVGGDVNITVNNMSSAKVEAQKDEKGNIIMTIRDEIKRGFTELRNPNSYNAKMVQASFNTTVKR